MKIIGLTGGIASGKTTVANVFKQRGFPVINADIVAHEALEIDSPTYSKIIEIFGNKILDKDKSINRDVLSRFVFSDESKRKTLENIVHPFVKAHIENEIQYFISKGEATIILDIPLLYECGWETEMDKVVVVWCSQEDQIKRAQKKWNFSREDILARINSQLPLYDKKTRADFVIDNVGDLNDLENQANAIIDKL
ncbi:dephospho-CoA kinase [bacterium]|nr:dephospho-CoA kinase [bacterium]